MDLSIIRTGAKQVGDILIKNSPTILTGLGVGGLITTVFTAVKVTPKAIRLIEEERLRREADELTTGMKHEKDLTKLDIIRLTWKCYIPVIVMGTVTGICIIGANRVSAKRYAALAGLYSITEKALTEYQEKVVEIVGKKKEEVIRGEIAKDDLNNNPITSPGQVVYTGKGESLFFDKLSARYFMSDMERIRKAVNDINHAIITGEGHKTLNEFYDELGLEHTSLGENMGWVMEHLLDVVPTAKVIEKGEYSGKPCVVLNYKVSPQPLWKNDFY